MKENIIMFILVVLFDLCIIPFIDLLIIFKQLDLTIEELGELKFRFYNFIKNKLIKKNDFDILNG